MFKSIVTIFIIFSLFVFLNPVAFAAELIPNDPEFSKQWYLEQIKAPEAWQYTQGSSEVVIAVIDSGIDTDHPDLKNNLWVNKNEIPDNGIDDDKNGYIDDINGWDFVNDLPDPNPKISQGYTNTGIIHGTMVSSIIAAVGNNNEGIAGVSWNSKIMPLRVFDNRGFGSHIDAERAIEYAINNGADIINMSFTGFSNTIDFSQIIEDAYRRGVLMVVAAGNTEKQIKGFDLDSESVYPVCFDENTDNTIIGVAGTDTLDQKADFSNFGSRCIDISAPAVNIFAAQYYDPFYDFTEYYNGYWDGTSVAAPLVSGAAALVKSINPNLNNKEIISLILENSDNIEDINFNYKGKLGTGRLNIEKAVLAALDRKTFLQNEYRIVVSPLTGYKPEVKFFNASGEENGSFLAFDENFYGGVDISTGDVDLDGQDEVIIGLGSGASPYVKVFDFQGNLKGQFFAYDPAFSGGVNVSVGDVDNDGAKEIVTGAGKGGGPHVRIFDKNGNLKGQFFANDPAFSGGVNVSVGDVDSDGLNEIIVGLGNGTSPYVKVFDFQGNLENQFLAYAENFSGGVNVAVGDADNDGSNEIIVGSGNGGGPHIRVFDGLGGLESQFFAYDPAFRGGVNVSVGDVDNDGAKEIVTGAGKGGGPHVRFFNVNGGLKGQFFTFPSDFRGGVNIASF